MDRVTVEFPDGYVNDLEKGVVAHITAEVLRWLHGYSAELPESHRMTGSAVDIETTKNHMSVDFHDPDKSGADGNRPKRLRMTMTIELKNYGDE